MFPSIYSLPPLWKNLEKVQASHWQVVRRETQHKLFTAVEGKMPLSIPIDRVGDLLPPIDNILESIPKSETEQGFWIDHEALQDSRTVSLWAALLPLILKADCQSIVCEVLHGLCPRSGFCALQYHPLKCICHCWHLGKEVRSGRTPLIKYFSCPRIFYQLIIWIAVWHTEWQYAIEQHTELLLGSVVCLVFFFPLIEN